MILIVKTSLTKIKLRFKALLLSKLIKHLWKRNLASGVYTSLRGHRVYEAQTFKFRSSPSNPKIIQLFNSAQPSASQSCLSCAGTSKESQQFWCKQAKNSKMILSFLYLNINLNPSKWVICDPNEYDWIEESKLAV